jgi:squalene-hopene/tetraprenyl-beta-curcumene cyclase
VVERLNGEDGLGAIYPAMANSVMMFDALGYDAAASEPAIAWISVRNLIVDDGVRAYCQPCVSPIWDTGLAGHAMAEAGYGSDLSTDPVQAASDWLAERQILDVKGDWAVRRPNVEPGGWAFQYNNAHYPDVDDTAMVGMLLHRNGDPAHANAIARARDWVIGMQSSDGGWGAFEPENTQFYLNHIPFADHGALLDPPTADVTARCVSFLAQIGMAATDPVLVKGVSYLRRDQEKDGSWFGRWGTNYIYGTWSVLTAFAQAGVGANDAAVRRAVEWLKARQNTDGGWGESNDTYGQGPAAAEKTANTPYQTAWALLALLAAGEAGSDVVRRGIEYLMRTQQADGLWSDPSFTAPGFPRVFYLKYHGYSAYFPLWALAAHRNLTSFGNSH